MTAIKYRFFYNEFGHLDSVNDIESGATVYVPNSPNYSLDNPLTAEFLATNPDLSDKPELAVKEET